jgi:hypothetical protein
MSPPDRPFLTIVSGLPRSGTSLMMRMLDAGGISALTDALRAPDPDNPNGYFEFEPVKRTKADPSWLNDATGRAVKMVYLLLADLPPGREYRVVFMRRDLREVIASQAAMLERQGKRGGGLAPEQLATMYAAQVDKTLAWLRAQPGFQLLEVDYNRLIADPGPAVEALDTFLGGGLDCAAMQAAVDPALYRQRR